jgi:3-oxoacyl-[acyl-carrier-protein] synthase II
MSAGVPASSASRTARAARCEFEPTEHLSVKEVRRADRFTQFALVSGDEALAEAGWSDELPYEADRIASILGTGIGGIGTLERGKEILIESGEKKVPPLSVPLMMSNAAAAAVSMRYKLLGPCHGIVSACSGGADAIGAAKMMIESGLGRRRRHRRLGGGDHAALARRVRRARRAVDERHLAPVRRGPRRLRHGRGRRHPGARRARGGRGPRREGARHAEGLRRFG